MSFTQRVGHYLSLVKFSHTVFALPFALIGFALGLYMSDAAFDWTLLIKVVLCMIFARNAAMGFNIDADIKQRLLSGLDFIGSSEQLNPQIADYEQSRKASQPWLG